ncbi:hypothetical protein LZ30DRAFT_812687 [Colletotrichum cereale]|nr:hypothetical protein LZ30DRAFT_812687 [Colletotrichum cereale]
MDPFSKLPSELREKILTLMRSRCAIIWLIQASPAMLRQYTTSKQYVTMGWVAANIDHEMIQDALAILFFPRRCTTGHTLATSRRLCRSWAAKRLRCPICEPRGRQDYWIIDQLSRLHRRLLLFIEDYLTKTTAVFPPREYLCLPGLLPTQTQLTFKGRPVTSRFDAVNLTELERERLLRAFLRCQLRSLVLQTRDRDLTESCAEELKKHEAIDCVYTYLESLYGAIFAHCTDSWLPDDSDSPHAPGLLYPDSVYVDPDTYACAMGLQDLVLKASSFMAGYGFDLVAVFLRHTTAGRHGRDRVKRWFTDVFPLRQGPFKFLRDGLVDFQMRPTPEEESVRYREELPGMYDMLRPLFWDSWWLHRTIYRQRAWAFLDDDRLYPSSGAKSHFPTQTGWDVEQYYRMKGDKERRLVVKRDRALRQSQKWHDEQHGNPSEDGKTETSEGPEPEGDCPHPLPDVLDDIYFRIPYPFWR